MDYSDEYDYEFNNEEIIMMDYENLMKEISLTENALEHFTKELNSCNDKIHRNFLNLYINEYKRQLNEYNKLIVDMAKNGEYVNIARVINH